VEVEELKEASRKLIRETQSLMLRDDKFNQDLVGLGTSIEFFMSSNEDKWKGADLKFLKSETRGADLLAAVESIEERLTGLELNLPSLMLMNTTTSESIGLLSSNISLLDEFTKVRHLES